MWKNTRKKCQVLVWGKRSEGTMWEVLGVLLSDFATVCEHEVIAAPALRDALCIPCGDSEQPEAQHVT